MSALYTYLDHEIPKTSNDPPLFDYWVHSFFYAPSQDTLRSLRDLHAVIPFGKLFARIDGRSEWTGYEVLITASSEIWAVYVLTDADYDQWNPVKCKLFPWNDRERPIIKVARLWKSFRSIEQAKFDEAVVTMKKPPKPQKNASLSEMARKYKDESILKLLSNK